jgi:hypothetical protein
MSRIIVITAMEVVVLVLTLAAVVFQLPDSDYIRINLSFS